MPDANMRSETLDIMWEAFEAIREANLKMSSDCIVELKKGRQVPTADVVRLCDTINEAMATFARKINGSSN
jgi:hypothetical protein